MILLPTLCITCEHMTNRGTYTFDEYPTCVAYPESIPFRFWQGGDHHSVPQGDQVGDLVFTARTDSEDVMDRFLLHWYTPDSSEYDPRSDEPNQSDVSGQ